jgi:aminodeoxyfutalosine synthase
MTIEASPIDALAERVASGGEVTGADAQLMLETSDLIAVGAIADDVRRRLHGSRTTFVRVFDVHPDAIPGALPARTSPGELRIAGVAKSAEAALAAVRGAAKIAAGRPLTGFSLADLLVVGDAAFGTLCRQLREAGLEAVAELPIDRLTDPAAAVREARDAGLEVVRLTTHNAPAEERVAICARARALQDAVGGFRAFAPLPRVIAAAAPTTGYDDVKLVAAARVLVHNIPSIQVDWAQYGPKLAQVALTMGADDVDAVAASDPGLLGARRSPLEEIRGNIRAAGLDAIERDGLFRALPA